MRQDIAFNAEGTTLRGWLYTPDAGKGPFPTVVMAHGFSAVKEMYLDSFAEVFAAFNQAREPKKLVVLPTRHFDAYTGSGFTIASGAARDWFVEHLIKEG